MGASASHYYAQTLTLAADEGNPSSRSGVRGPHRVLYCKRELGSLQDAEKYWDRSKAADLDSLIDHSMDKVVKEMFQDGLPGSYYCLIELLRHALVKENYHKYDNIQKEMINSGRIFMVQRGEIYISQFKKPMRTLTSPLTYVEWLKIGKDSLVDIDNGPTGELGLLLNCLFTPNIRCKTDEAVVWSLNRGDFQRIASLVVGATRFQRMKWLNVCPELRLLGSTRLIRLVLNMKVENFKDGDVMYSYGDVGRRILMIELGEAVICFPDHKIAERELDSIGLDHLLGVERPEGLFLRAVRDMNTHQLCQFLRHADVDTPAVSEQIPTDPYREPEQPNTCALTAGCILGIGAIRGKARLNTDGFWTWLPDRFTDETYHGRTTYDGRSISGAKYPYTVVAKGDVQCLTFSVDTLTSLFGPPEELVTTAMNVMKENYLYDKEKFTSPSKAPHWKELDSLGVVDTTDSLSIDSEIKADSKLEINLHGREELKQRKGDPELSSYTDGVTLMTPTRNCDLDEFPDKKPT